MPSSSINVNCSTYAGWCLLLPLRSSRRLEGACNSSSGDDDDEEEEEEEEAALAPCHQ